MKLFKKLAVSSLVLTSVNAMASTEVESIATWKATAVKDTTSALVVTPLDSLSFDYAAGVGNGGAFNTQKGMFDVTLEGDTSATDFRLTAEKVTGTLSHLSHNSTLEVDVIWAGESLSNSHRVTIVDTMSGVHNALNLASLGSAFNLAGRTSAQESFTFAINGGMLDGLNPIDGDYSLLPDGIWSGDVKVRFIAEWQ